MRKFTDDLAETFGNFIPWLLIFLCFVFIWYTSTNHFLGSARHKREVMEGSLREAKMPEAQIRAISESFLGLETDVQMLVTITFMFSAAIIANACSRRPERSSRKVRTKIKEQTNSPESGTT